MLPLNEKRTSPLSHDPSFPFLLSLLSPCPYSLVAAISALSVLCSVLLACLGVSAVAVILSSSVSLLPTKFYHRDYFLFISCLFAFAFLSVSLFVLLVLFLVGHHFFGYKSSVKLVLSVGSVNVIPSTVFKVVWLVVITCRSVPVR